MTSIKKNSISIFFGLFLILISLIVFLFAFFVPEKYDMPYWISGLICGVGIIFAFPKSIIAQLIVNLLKKKTS